MRPAGQRLDALAPCGDRRMVLADVEAEFFDGVKEISGERHIRDGRPLPEHEVAALEPLVDDGEIAVDAAFEERENGRIAGRLGEVLQEPVRPKKTVDLLIVENDPAQ